MSENLLSNDRLFELLAQTAEAAEEMRAPARLKSRVYSALVRRQEEAGPLRGLDETRSEQYGLCIFEDLWQRAISAEGAQTLNCCRFCHARVLAEHLENAPIYWANCPYVAFGKK